MRDERVPRSAGLAERGEWLSPRDIQEIFSLSHTAAWEVCRRLPHIRVGRSIRVARRDVVDALRTGSI